MSIHDGHRNRKKEQYRRQGLQGMADHEALELLLYYAIPRRDTNTVAHRLIETFGSLEGVLTAPMEALTRVEGMGENSALLLRLIHDVHAHVSAQPGTAIRLDSVGACGTYAMKLLNRERNEVLYQFCVDNKGKLIREYVLSRGTMDAASVNVQKVVENALLCGCTNVVLAHNHPGGVALPSKDDRATTRRLVAALESVNIRLLDHIIVADGDYTSMLQSFYL